MPSNQWWIEASEDAKSADVEQFLADAELCARYNAGHHNEPLSELRDRFGIALSPLAARQEAALVGHRCVGLDLGEHLSDDPTDR